MSGDWPVNRRNNLWLLATLGSLAVAACGPVNRSVESQKAPVVETQNLAYEVRFDGDSLSPAQAVALEDYLAAIRIAYGDRISIDDPVTEGAAARRAAIAGVVAKFGLMLQPTGPLLGGQIAPGTARVVIARTQVGMPDCPDWRRKSNPEVEGSAMSNYGCATRGNLAEMVADPNDLLAGKTYSGADGHTTTKAINVFRESKPTGTRDLDRAGISARGGN